MNKNLSEVIAYKAHYGTILSWNYGLAHVIHFGCLCNPISDTLEGLVLLFFTFTYNSLHSMDLLCRWNSLTCFKIDRLCKLVWYFKRRKLTSHIFTYFCKRDMISDLQKLLFKMWNPKRDCSFVNRVTNSDQIISLINYKKWSLQYII